MVTIGEGIISLFIDKCMRFSNERVSEIRKECRSKRNKTRYVVQISCICLWQCFTIAIHILCAHCTYSCSMRLMENMFLSSIKSVFLWYYSRHLNRWHVKIRINGSLMDFIKWATSMLVTKLNLANRIKNESISVYDFFFWNSNLYINNKINGSGVIGFTCPSQILIKSPKYDYTNYLDKHKKSKHINGIMSISIVHFCSPFIDEKKQHLNGSDCE